MAAYSSDVLSGPCLGWAGSSLFSAFLHQVPVQNAVWVICILYLSLYASHDYPSHITMPIVLSSHGGFPLTCICAHIQYDMYYYIWVKIGRKRLASVMCSLLPSARENEPNIPRFWLTLWVPSSMDGVKASKTAFLMGVHRGCGCGAETQIQTQACCAASILPCSNTFRHQNKPSQMAMDCAIQYHWQLCVLIICNHADRYDERCQLIMSYQQNVRYIPPAGCMRREEGCNTWFSSNVNLAPSLPCRVDTGQTIVHTAAWLQLCDPHYHTKTRYDRGLVFHSLLLCNDICPICVMAHQHYSA